MIEGEERVYDQCDAEVNFKQRVFEARPEVRGDIARTYFYFENTYGMKIGKKDKKLLEVWDRQDPVSDEERNRIELIWQGVK